MEFSKKAFTLVDILVGTAILVIVMTSIFVSFRLLFKILSQSQGKVVAVNIAKEQIEIIRNLPYIDIGTQGGIPAGEILQTKTKQVDGKIYTIDTDIIYIDDPFDETAPTDDLSADYKKARIKVSWQEDQTTKSITEITNISPPNLESEVGGGTLSIYVNDSQSGEPIDNAQVEITNNDVDPTVYLFTFTDENGWLSRPGLAPSDFYQIQVGKTEYNQHRTYTATASLDPDPEYSHAQLIEGQKTSRYFVISKSSDININTIDRHNQPLADISFTLKGGRAIGFNPIASTTVYSYDNDNLITNASGTKALIDMSGGEYYLTVSEANYAVLTPNLEKPVIVEADAIEEIILTLASTSQPYLRLLVKDASTDDEIPDALARLYNGGYDKSSQTNEDGIAIFPFDEEELTNGNYTLTISKNGYESYNNPQTINNFTEKTVQLNPL